MYIVRQERRGLSESLWSILIANSLVLFIRVREEGDESVRLRGQGQQIWAWSEALHSISSQAVQSVEGIF